jgi:hypothetical protein
MVAVSTVPAAASIVPPAVSIVHAPETTLSLLVVSRSVPSTARPGRCGQGSATEDQAEDGCQHADERARAHSPSRP